MAWNGSNGKVGSRVPRDRTCTTNATAAGAGLRARRDSRPYRNGLLAGLLVIALGGAAVWWFFGRGGIAPTAPKPTHKTQRITERKPAQVTRATNEVATAVTLNENPVTKPLKPKYLGTVVTQRFERTVTLLDGTVTNLVHKPTFTNQMEQILSCALNPHGIVVPLRLALRRYSEEQLRKMFHTDIYAEPGDSERVLERKLELQELKLEVREMEKQGVPYSEILNEIDKIGRNTRAEVRAAREGLSQLIKAGESKEVINDWIKEKNAVLKDLGEHPIRVPVGYELNEQTKAVGKSE